MTVRGIATFLCLFVFTTISTAQTFRGAIQGSVTDSTGAAVPGAEVTVTNLDTNLNREVSTDGEGNYFFPELPLGSYKVAAAKAGFRTVAVGPISIAVAAAQKVNITLDPGDAKESVEVHADVPLVDATGDAQGGTLNSQQVAELPIN